MYTAEEFYRLNGYLSRDYAEPLLDASDKLQHVTGIAAYIQEGMSQFPAEDFLADIKDRLHTLAKRMYKGDNKTELLAIIEAMDDQLQCQFYATEYGTSELHKALKVIK